MQERRLSNSSSDFSDTFENEEKEKIDKFTLLVVNDNFPLLNMLADMLEDFFNVKTSNNGLEALDIVFAQPRNYFDVIVLDINMPIMDGFETCSKINNYLASQNVIQMVEVNKDLKNHKTHFDDDSPSKSMFVLKEKYKRSLTPMIVHEQDDWRKDKRPLIYAYTGDVNPGIEKKAEALGFKKAFTVFKRDQINEIIDEISRRNFELESIFKIQNESHSNVSEQI